MDRGDALHVYGLYNPDFCLLIANNAIMSLKEKKNTAHGAINGQQRWSLDQFAIGRQFVCVLIFLNDLLLLLLLRDGCSNCIRAQQDGNEIES